MLDIVWLRGNEVSNLRGGVPLYEIAELVHITWGYNELELTLWE